MTGGSEPLRVCFLTFPPHRYSGAVFHAVWLAEKLGEMGVEVEFLSYDEEPPPDEPVGGFPVRYLSVGGGRFPEVGLAAGMARHFLARRYDVVHVHSAAYPKSLAAPAARLAGSGCLATVMQEGADLAAGGRLEGPVHRRLLRLFHRVVALSDETLVEARSAGVDPDRLVKIPIAVDIDRFRPAAEGEKLRCRSRHGLPSDPPLVAYVGAFSDRKNVVWLLDRWLRSPEARGDAHLLVVGDVANDPEGPHVRREVEQLLRRADRRNVPIHWIPFVEEIEEVYAASDVFVLPSLREGMPSVLLQAMASGLPVLTTPVSGARELVGEDGRRGLLFGFDDAEGLRAGLAELLESPERRRRMGRAARAHVADRFSLESVAGRYRALYGELS